MNQNPMQLFQMFAQLKNNPNPMNAANLMFGNNPMFQQAVQMTQGKDPNAIRQIIQNVAREKNIDPQQLNQWASQFGLTL